MSSLTLCFLLLLAVAHAKDYCSVCIDHTMCRFGDTIGRRCGKSSEGGVTDSEIQTILNLHNAYRSKVATGGETQGTPGPQPTAANMQSLVWDRKLAAVAQRWADQCTVQQDKCRDDQRFSVGQNIYYSSGLEAKNWTRAVESWYEEVKHVNASQIDRYFHHNEASHYAQLVWAETRYIGCARRSYFGIYRPRADPPIEYVLDEARSKEDDVNRSETGYFGDKISESDLEAGKAGAIASKDTETYYASASHTENNAKQARQHSDSFVEATFDSNTTQRAVTKPGSGNKPNALEPPTTSANVLARPVYAFNNNTQPQKLAIPSLAYPVYKPHYPTYSQYRSYEAAKMTKIKGSSKDSSEESSEEDSSEESSEEKSIIVPASLQFNSWTKDGWKMIDYDLSIDQIYICNYGPAGKSVDEPIYMAGPPCSACPSDSKCQNGLCV